MPKVSTDLRIDAAPRASVEDPSVCWFLCTESHTQQGRPLSSYSFEEALWQSHCFENMEAKRRVKKKETLANSGDPLPCAPRLWMNVPASAVGCQVHCGQLPTLNVCFTLLLEGFLHAWELVQPQARTTQTCLGVHAALGLSSTETEWESRDNAPG